MFLSLRLSERRTLLALSDLILVNLTVLLALWIWTVRGGLVFDRSFIANQIEWFFLLSALWLLASYFVGLYELPRITHLSAATNSLAQAIILVILAYMGIYFFLAGPDTLPRGIVLYQGMSSFILIILSRALFLTLVRHSLFSRKAVIVGAGKSGQEIARLIQQHARAHYQLVGFIDDDPIMRGRMIRIKPDSNTTIELPVLGASHELVSHAQANDAHEIILAITKDISASLLDALLACKIQGKEITLMPLLYEQLTGMVPIDYIGNNWNAVLPLETAESGGWYPITKRVFDITGALVGLTLYAPILPLIMLFIRLDSAGPIFYSQARVGKGGKVFQTLKLRTMITEAEKDGARRATTNDPRITRVGRWLRKTRLDEMPQLLNVLMGDMSAVGPRPERPEHIKEFEEKIPFHSLRNAVRPGMAGWAVINYDYVETLQDAKIRLQYDLYYIKHQSLWLDLLILLRTMGQMIALRGR